MRSSRAGLVVAMSGQSLLPAKMAALGVDGLTYRWTMAYLLPGAQKQIPGARLLANAYKPLLVYKRDGAEVASWMKRDTASSPTIEKGNLGHRWGQTEKGMLDILDALDLPRGLVVADPFCGAGSSLVAARALGNSVVGGDIDADCVADTERALQEVRDE